MDPSKTALAASPVRTWGMHLLQAGMVLVVAALPVSIALMNTGLGLAWLGVLLARAPVHKTVGFWWGMAYVAWQIVSRMAGLVEGRDVSGGFGMMYTWTGLCLAQVAFSGQSSGAALARRWSVRLLLFSTGAAVLVALGQFFIGHQGSARPLRISPGGTRFGHGTGFFAIHLTFGVMMMMMILVALGGALRTWSGWRTWGWILGGLATVGLVFSMGRLSFVGIAVGGAALVAAFGRRYFLRAVLAGLAMAMIAGVVLATLQPTRFEKMLRFEDGRWPIWKTSVTMAAQHPVVGIGSSRAYRSAYLDLYDVVNPSIPNEFPKGAPHAHNAFLSLVAEHGLPAVVLWLALLVVVLRALHARVATHPQTWRTGAALVAGFLAAGLFEHLAGDGESCHALWTLLGACLASFPDHDHA